MPADETGTEVDDGQSVEEDLFGEDVESDDDVTLTDGEVDEESEESDEDEGQPDETEEDKEDKFDYKKGYKELQKGYNESREEVKESNTQRESLENQFVRFGGVDKAMAALDFVNTDQDFRDLVVKKQNNEIIGVDESKLSPQQKEAFNTVRQVVKGELAPVIADFNKKLKELVDSEISPHTNAMKDVNLEHHIDKMTDKYGDGWLSQLDSMEKLKSTLPDQAKIAPTFNDIDRLYIESLRENGLFDKFIISQAKVLAKGKKDKTTKRPRSSGGTETGEKDKSKPPADMMEAGARVLARRK